MRYLVDEMLRKEKQKLVNRDPMRHGYVEFDGKRYEYSKTRTVLEVYLKGNTVIHSHIKNSSGKPMGEQEIKETVIYLLEQTKEMVAKVTGEV